MLNGVKNDASTSVIVVDNKSKVIASLKGKRFAPECGDHLLEVEDEEGLDCSQFRDTFRRALRYGEPSTCLESIHGTLTLLVAIPFNGLLASAKNAPKSIVLICRPVSRHVIRFAEGCGIDLASYTSYSHSLKEMEANAPRDAMNAYVLSSSGITLYSEIREIVHEPSDGEHYSIWCKALPNYADALHATYEACSMGTPTAYLSKMESETILSAWFPYYGHDENQHRKPVLQLVLASVIPDEHQEFLRSVGIAI